MEDQWIHGDSAMLTHAENETLCRVGRDTPMGKVMRRYWHPIAASDQLPCPDSDPLRITLLGEKLVGLLYARLDLVRGECL